MDAPIIGFAFADVAQAFAAAFGIPIQNGAVIARLGRAVDAGLRGLAGKLPFVGGGQAFVCLGRRSRRGRQTMKRW